MYERRRQRRGCSGHDRVNRAGPGAGCPNAVAIPTGRLAVNAATNRGARPVAGREHEAAFLTAPGRTSSIVRPGASTRSVVTASSGRRFR